MPKDRATISRLSAKAENIDGLAEKVRDAWYSSRPQPAPVVAADVDTWVREVWDEYIIVEVGSVDYRVPYTRTDAGVTFAGRDEWVEVERVWQEAKSLDTLVAVGSPLKALGDGKVGGYLVLFSSADSPDLTGDYFDASTDFDVEDGQKTAVYYQHGYDERLGARKLGTGTLTVDEVGVWVEAQLALRDEYERAIYELAEAGKLGWSSGTAPHLVEREPAGKAQHITRWPLGLDASITPTPAEPRLSVMPLKAFLAEIEPAVKGLLPEGAPDEGAPAGATASEKPAVTILEPTEATHTEDTNMGEEIDIKTVVAAAVEETWKRLANEDPRVVGEHATMDDAIEAQEGTKSFGDFLLAVRRHDTKRIEGVYKSTMVEGDGSLGGYLVPEGFRANLLKLIGEGSIVRSRTTPIPADLPKTRIPALTQTGGPAVAGDPVWFGGVHMHWTEEAGAKTETNAEFEMIELAVHEISGYTQTSNALAKDSARAGLSISTLLQTLFAGAYRWQEDYVFLRGNGVAKPMGVLESPCLKTIARKTAAHINYQDIRRMFAYWIGDSGVWLVSRGPAVDELLAMEDSEGHLVWQPNAATGMPGTLMGMPVVITEKMPTLGTKGDLTLNDFSKYIIYDMNELAVDFSEHYAFTNNKGTWRCSERIDGAPWLKSVITLTDGSTTVSPFVALGNAEE